MSLYGALFGGVSGLNAQGSKIAIVSDNIANVNTVGYKESEALFETLVINSGSSVSYQTGGVTANSRMNVDQQGLLLSTNAATDVAISGDGFFTVNGNVDGSGQPLYTRAGSFRQDSQGNFVNAAGFFLQGWPLDRNGLLPGEPGNANSTSFSDLSSIETVNVESASGVAQATSIVAISANLDAGEAVLAGQGLTTTMDTNNAANTGISAAAIIAPAEPFGTVGVAPSNNITRGDSFEIVTGLGPVYAYEYGGFTVSREITTAFGTNYGDGLADNSRNITGADTLADATFVSDGAGTYTTTIANHGLVTGDQIVITGSNDTNQLPNGSFAITALSNNTFSFVPTPLVTDPGVGASPSAVVAATTLTYSPFDTTGNIFSANSVSDAFFTDTTRFSAAALTFSITTSSDTHTFTFTSSSPNTRAGQFNNMLTLAEAINEVAGLTSRVVTDPNGGGRLLVGGEDANEPLTFSNGEFPQGVFDETTTGIDWVSELDVSNIGTGTRRFSSLAGLEALVDADDGVTGVVENALANATLAIRADNPLDTIRFRDMQDEVSFNIPLSAGASTYTVTGAGPYTGGVDDIPVTLATTIDYSTTLTAGDTIVITDETAGLAGLPGVFPNTSGSAFAAGVHLTVASVTATEVNFTIPASLYSGTVAAAGVADASGLGVLSVVGKSNQGSLIAELFAGTTDLVADPNVNSLAGDPYVTKSIIPPNLTTTAGIGPQDTDVLGPRYDSSGTVGDNMASGDIDAQFSRSILVYDALGTGHNLQAGFIKVDANEWRVELYAVDETEVNTSLPDGQVATGTIVFNGDGSLRSVSDSLVNNIDIVWTNGAESSSITFDWGTAGQPFGTADATAFGDTDGLSQFDSDYSVDFVNQNGSSVGELIGVTIDDDGQVIASYSNGEANALYKLPIADFSNPNGLQSISGNVFAQTNDSGDVNLREAGSNGVGTVVGASLEQSNVELSEQLTDLIVAQRAYQSNTRVISATDELLEQLNNI
jgi:flagellar hook protein FlgE